MSRSHVSVTLLASAAALGVACADDAISAEDELVSIGLASTADLEVELLATRSLAVGHNAVFFKIETLPDHRPVTSATVTHEPIMHMTMMDMEHSCPNVQPAAAVDGVYPAFIVFQMASGTGMDADTWRDEVTIDLGDGSAARTVVFEALPVAASSARKDLPYTDAMGGTATAIVTFGLDRDAKVGLNPFTVTVHSKADMHGMMWDALEDLTIHAVPDMPSMGHGSTGNVDPTHVGDGRYTGTLNLTMPGVWRVVLTVDRGAETLGTLEYTLSF